MAPRDLTDEDLYERRVYLEDGFDPSRLKVAQLRSILLSHNVKYNASAKKPKLEELFRNEVLSRREELRKKYWNVVASGVNIEPASPGSPEEKEPKPIVVKSPRRGTHTKVRGQHNEGKESRASKGRSASMATSDEEAGNEPEPDPSLQLSPRALRALRRRGVSGTLQQAGEVPELAPTSRASSPPASASTSTRAHSRSPASPASPTRRKLAGRKVEIPSIDSKLAQPPAAELPEIKLKAPRAAKRKARDEEEEHLEENSFVNDNVFQRTTPSKRVKRESQGEQFAKPEVEPFLPPDEEMLLDDAENAAAVASEGLEAASRALNAVSELDSLLTPERVESLERSFEESSRRAAEIEEGEKIVLDEILESALPEMQEPVPEVPKLEVPKQEVPSSAKSAEPEPVAAKPKSAKPASAKPESAKPKSAKPESAKPASAKPASAKPASAKPAATKPEPAKPAAAKPEPVEPEPVAAEPEVEQTIEVLEAPGVEEISEVSLITEPPAGGAFLPRLSHLSAPAEATSSTPSEKDTRPETHREAYTEAPDVSLIPDVSYLPDAELVAAKDFHNMFNQLPEAKLPKPKLRVRVPRVSLPRPRLPRVRIPRLRLPTLRIPRPRLPTLRFPRVRFPSVRFPRLRLPRFPRVRFPSLRFPRLRLPRVRIPRPRLPTIRLPRVRLPSVSTLLKPIRFGFSALLRILVWAAMLAAFAQLASLVLWYRDEYAAVQFCGTGAMNFPTYPAWTEVNTGSEPLTQMQQYIRHQLDRVRPVCLPCPPHAECYQDRVVVCDPEYQLEQPVLARLGVWPFPATCRNDWELRRRLDVIGDAARTYLQQRRAAVLCEEDPHGERTAAELDALSSVSDTELREHLYERKWETLDDEAFADLWRRVYETLSLKYPDVYEVSVTLQTGFEHELTNNSENSNDRLPRAGASAERAAHKHHHPAAGSSGAEKRFVTSSEALVPLGCRLRRTVLAQYFQHRAIIHTAAGSSLLLTLALTFLYRRWRTYHRLREEAQRLIALVKANHPSYTMQKELRQPYLNLNRLKQWEHLQKLVQQDPHIRARQIIIDGEYVLIWEWVE